MILGLGNDIISVARIQKVCDRYGEKFLSRVFTEKEQAYCLKHKESTRHLAGRFAAKEAVVKAIGNIRSLGISWQDIEILNDEEGRPTVHLSPKIQQKVPHTFLLSISHCHDFATAVAIMLQ